MQLGIHFQPKKKNTVTTTGRNKNLRFKRKNITNFKILKPKKNKKKKFTRLRFPLLIKRKMQRLVCRLIGSWFEKNGDYCFLGFFLFLRDKGISPFFIVLCLVTINYGDKFLSKKKKTGKLGEIEDFKNGN